MTQLAMLSAQVKYLESGIADPISFTRSQFFGVL